MANKNILIRKKNGDEWHKLFPITIAKNVKCSNGKDVESEIANVANKTRIEEIDNMNKKIKMTTESLNKLCSSEEEDKTLYVDSVNGNDINSGEKKYPF